METETLSQVSLHKNLLTACQLLFIRTLHSLAQWMEPLCAPLDELNFYNFISEQLWAVFHSVIS